MIGVESPISKILIHLFMSFDLRIEVQTVKRDNTYSANISCLKNMVDMNSNI
jgi:hypothetical protein